MTPREAVEAWRRFATTLKFRVDGEQRTWAQHIDQAQGSADEESLVQPVAFPRFAQELLGFEIGQTLAAERSDVEGRPDFTPADAVTHPFVFEVKGTRDSEALAGHDEQVHRYLTDGRERIRKVVLTNLVGLKVFELDASGNLFLLSHIALRGLLTGDIETVATSGEADRLADFLDGFSRHELSEHEKLNRVRSAPPWNPILEVTNPDWLSARIDSVVNHLRRDVSDQVSERILTNRARVTDEQRASILNELHELEWRVGADWEVAHERTLDGYVAASDGTTAHLALRQYEGHVSYYAATRLLLVRIWEDIELIGPVLCDGGFDDWMARFDDAVSQVVEHSFYAASDKYPSLFQAHNNYAWYSPSESSQTDVLYELGNTYFGNIKSDVLGVVYERLLERLDRKLIGQYYTPRDIVALIWDLIAVDSLAEEADIAERPLRVLDIATGSGGFLVEAAARLHSRIESRRNQGADITLQAEVNRFSTGLIGIELQRFPAFLAELNLLIQISPALRLQPQVHLPPFGILHANSLALHNPIALGVHVGEVVPEG